MMMLPFLLSWLGSFHLCAAAVHHAVDGGLSQIVLKSSDPEFPGFVRVEDRTQSITRLTYVFNTDVYPSEFYGDFLAGKTEISLSEVLYNQAYVSNQGFSETEIPCVVQGWNATVTATVKEIDLYSEYRFDLVYRNGADRVVREETVIERVYAGDGLYEVELLQRSVSDGILFDTKRRVFNQVSGRL